MIQEISYGGWSRNLLISGQNTELVVTLDVGPRVIRYAFKGDKNVFIELADQMGGTGELEWKIRGGHRLWTAPEAGHSYDLDNDATTWKKLGDCAVEVTAPVSKAFGFQKAMRIELLENEIVRATHFLTNKSGKALDLTPWVLTVMAPGGVALIPQPPLDLHPSEFLRVAT